MCGGGGGGGGGGSIQRVAPPVVPQTPRYQGDPAPPTQVKPTPLFTEDRIEKPTAPKPPAVVAKPRPSPLSTAVTAVTNFFKPTVDPPKEEAPPAAVARPKPSPVRPAPPMPAMPSIPVSEPVAPAPVARRPAPV